MIFLIILVLTAQPVSSDFEEMDVNGMADENVTDEPEPNITEPDTIPDEEIPSPNITEPVILPSEETSKTLPSFVIAVSNQAPASNIILIGNIVQSLINEGYASISAIKLFSEIDALTDVRVILAVYYKEAVIIVREDAPQNYANFSADLKNILNQDGITDVKVLSGSDLESSNLLDLFDTTKKECSDLPEQAIKKCEETEGTVVKRVGPKGCPFMNCEYVSKPGFMEPAAECLTEDVLDEMEEKCRSTGIEPFIVKDGGCRYVKCSGKPPEVKICAENIEAVNRVKEECKIKDGRIVKNFDSKGCPITVCVQPEFECERDVPLEAHENCEVEGGNLVIRRDEKGCVRLVECAKRGNIDVAYEKVEEIPPATRLLSIASQLETLKIKCDETIIKLRGIVNYFEEAGNTEKAERFKKVLGLFLNTNDEIEGLKAKLRENSRNMTEENLMDIKHDIKYVSETVMRNAFYITFGGKIELEGSIGVTEEGYIDCGEDSECMDEALMLCEPAVLRHNGTIFATIKGLDSELCDLEVTFQDAKVVCKIEDYITIHSEDRDVLQYCEGDNDMLMPTIRIIVHTQADCEKMTDSDKKNQCYEAVSSTTKDARLCEKITDSSRKENCYHMIARETKDISFCEKISDKDKKYMSCYSEIAAVLEDVSICETIPDREGIGEEEISNLRLKTDCYTKVAVKAQDSSICKKIIKDNDETRCYFNCGIEDMTGYGNINECPYEEITRDNDRAKCYAIVAKDAGICETITAEFTKNSCYSAVAVETKDASICEKINVIFTRDGCYYNLHDESLCERITDSRMRDNC